MSHYYAIPLFNTAELAETRRVTGPGFSRVVRYFQNEGVKAIVSIEHALHIQSATAMVLPAHTLKGEARQLGATRLADIAEAIETRARVCVEKQLPPEGVAAEVAMLRGCFTETLQHLIPAPASDSTVPLDTPPASAGTNKAARAPTRRRSVIFGRRAS